MRIIKDKSLMSRLKPEFTEDEIRLSPYERDILEKALAICNEAGELQSKINSEARIDDCQENSYEWAYIYLKESLELESGK